MNSSDHSSDNFTTMTLLERLKLHLKKNNRVDIFLFAFPTLYILNHIYLEHKQEKYEKENIISKIEENISFLFHHLHTIMYTYIPIMKSNTRKNKHGIILKKEDTLIPSFIISFYFYNITQ
jgi:hypothetical protein